ncbi:hypothetical protein RhiirA4_488942 [Rhizophagus irregularis]|uniref:Uncharacterized protein n=1 Tax=Rhizophagus irregularis TaxID=588596 RepID=A0A2I1HUA4_9GLOM|nr:hypothetical protein RhiirA4_488942 [Rhizophagus irregularis]
MAGDKPVISWLIGISFSCSNKSLYFQQIRANIPIIINCIPDKFINIIIPTGSSDQ